MITDRKSLLAALLAVGLLSTGLARAQQPSPWLHIRVVENGDEGRKVSVNLPISLVAVALDVAEAELHRQGHQLRHEGFEVEDLRRIWKEVCAAGDAEFVTIEDDEQTVRISRQGERVLVEIEDPDEGTQKGRIELPVSVVEALLSGGGEDLDMRGALEELVRTQVGEIVRVEKDETSVRVWIE
ncbi:MAG: hypothetical protein ACE5HV_10655 [Acidobacteriota bacterium]